MKKIRAGRVLAVLVGVAALAMAASSQGKKDGMEAPKITRRWQEI